MFWGLKTQLIGVLFFLPDIFKGLGLFWGFIFTILYAFSTGYSSYIFIKYCKKEDQNIDKNSKCYILKNVFYILDFCHSLLSPSFYFNVGSICLHFLTNFNYLICLIIFTISSFFITEKEYKFYNILELLFIFGYFIYFFIECFIEIKQRNFSEIFEFKKFQFYLFKNNLKLSSCCFLIYGFVSTQKSLKNILKCNIILSVIYIIVGIFSIFLKENKYIKSPSIKSIELLYLIYFYICLYKYVIYEKYFIDKNLIRIFILKRRIFGKKILLRNKCRFFKKKILMKNNFKNLKRKLKIDFKFKKNNKKYLKYNTTDLYLKNLYINLTNLNGIILKSICFFIALFISDYNIIESFCFFTIHQVILIFPIIKYGRFNIEMIVNIMMSLLGLFLGCSNLYYEFKIKISGFY